MASSQDAVELPCRTAKSSKQKELPVAVAVAVVVAVTVAVAAAVAAAVEAVAAVSPLKPESSMANSYTQSPTTYQF